MNWRELKDFCNQLPESEMDKQVIIWRESEAITDLDASQLDEDYVVNLENNEDGCFPISEAESQIKHNPEDFPNGLEHFKKVYDKGTPIIHENF